MPSLAFDPEETIQWEQTHPRTISPEKWKKFEGYAAEIFTAFGMDLDTPGTRTTPTRFLRALYDATVRLRGRPQAADGVSDRVSRRPGLQHRPGHRGTDRVLLAVRAPRPSVPRARLHRLHRARGDHRHLQADPPGAGVRPALHRAGAGRRADRRRAGARAPAARRGRAPVGHAPVHADARRARGPLAHVDVFLARQLRDPTRSCARSSCRPPCSRTTECSRRSTSSSRQTCRTTRCPADLKHVYGRLGFTAPILYSNFVSSLDGVVTLGSKPSAGSVISGKYPADRFLMGLLRACADAVVLGAGTLRATPGHLWTPAHVYPALATEFTALRSALGRSAEPALVLLTATGEHRLHASGARQGRDRHHHRRAAPRRSATDCPPRASWWRWGRERASTWARPSTSCGRGASTSCCARAALT